MTQDSLTATNHAYWLSKHQPEMLLKIYNSIEGDTEYVRSFKQATEAFLDVEKLKELRRNKRNDNDIKF